MVHRRILIVGAIVAIVLSMPFFGRTWNKFFHELGAVLFLGNIMVSALWMGISRRSGSPDAFRLGVNGIMLTDAAFTTPGAILLAVNGAILAPAYMQAHAVWLFAGMGLFAVTGIVWMAVLLPAQRRLWQLVSAMPAGGPVPAECEAVYARWFRFGGIATLLPLAALVMMVFKPTF